MLLAVNRGTSKNGAVYAEKRYISGSFIGYTIRDEHRFAFPPVAFVHFVQGQIRLKLASSTKNTHLNDTAHKQSHHHMSICRCLSRVNAANAPTFCVGHASFKCKYLVSCEIVSFVEVRRKGLTRCGSRLSLARLELHPGKQSNMPPRRNRKRAKARETLQDRTSLPELDLYHFLLVLLQLM